MASATIVGATGSALLLLNEWTGPGRAQLAGLFDSSATAVQTSAAHKELVKIGASLLFIGALTLIAGQSEQWGNVALAIIASLFVLWAINHYAKN